MLKTEFIDKEEFVIYISEQQLRMKKGFLTCSERKQLETMLNKDYKPTFIKENKPHIPIITDINYLRQPCAEITKEDNYKEIMQKLKDTLESVGGLGISANQIGIQKRISYIKIPKFTNKNREIEYNEYILINPKIIEHDNPIKVRGEGCLSFPGVYVDTLRYIYCTVEYLDENFKQQTGLMQDIEAFCFAHEIDHTNGIILFDRRYKDINYRKTRRSR